MTTCDLFAVANLLVINSEKNQEMLIIFDVAYILRINCSVFADKTVKKSKADKLTDQMPKM